MTSWQISEDFLLVMNLESICSLPRSGGVQCMTSKPSVKRYFFDANLGKCSSFQYTQCGGNGNNFETMEECSGFCAKRM